MSRPPVTPETEGLMPFAEIARRTGMSYDAVLETYESAMRKLRDALRAEGINGARTLSEDEPNDA